MRPRTRLTAPPDEQPAPPDAPAAPAHEDAEHYVPGLGLPREPRPPGRHRKHLVVLASLVVLLLAGWLAITLITAGSDFDPAVGDIPETGDQPQVPASPRDGTTGTG